MPPRLPYRLASLLFACVLVARVGAAELGEVKVNSFIGQHLSADIELTTLDDPATPVQVRLASLDVYRGANLDMPSVLAAVNLSVMRRDGKQFLHVTSTRPVQADHLHLYVELTDGNRRGVRLATLWFTPDPTPAPVPDWVAIPMTLPGATAPSASARKSAPIRPLPAGFVPKATTNATKLAPLVKVESDADAPMQKAESARAIPTPSRERETRRPEAAARNEKPATADAPPVPLPSNLSPPARPAPLKLAKPAAAPACKKQPSEAEGTCAALDSKNAELRAEIGKLETRVNALLAQQNSPQAPVSPQVAPKPEPVQAAQPGHSVEDAGKPALEHVPASPPRPAVKAPAAHAAQAKAKEEPAGMPWGWIAAAGAAVFGIIGALQFWRHRRKPAKSATVHAPLPSDEESQVEPTLG